ncbi:MAG: leucine-rich repeat domain-containing protein [Bacteroidota bacterium]
MKEVTSANLKTMLLSPNEEVVHTAMQLAIGAEMVTEFREVWPVLAYKYRHGKHAMGEEAVGICKMLGLKEDAGEREVGGAYHLENWLDDVMAVGELERYQLIWWCVALLRFGHGLMFKLTKSPDRSFFELITRNGALLLNGLELENLPEHARHFPSVLRLNMRKNPLNTIPKGLATLPNLSSALFANCELTTAKFPAEDFPNLKAIDLSYNRLKSFPIDLLDLPQLRQLSLVGNPITEFDPAGKSCPSLENLSLFDLQLRKIGPLDATFPNLTTLAIDLRSGGDHHALLRSIARLEHLTALRFFDLEAHPDAAEFFWKLRDDVRILHYDKTKYHWEIVLPQGGLR